MKDKTLILTSINQSSEKAVLNLEQSSDGIQGFIRLYNFKEIPAGILTLAFLFDKKVYKYALNNNGRDIYTFIMDDSVKISDFTCALVNIKNGEAKPLLVGSTALKELNNIPSALVDNFDLLDMPDLKINEVKERLDESKIDYDDSEKEEIENTINESLCQCNKCSNCEYRNAFYDSSINGINNQTNKNPQEGNIQKKVLTNMSDINNETTFYDEIKEQIEILFEKYPEETFLNEIIPNSKWIKIDYEDDGNYFVIGLLYEDDCVSYICYGIPGEHTQKPPSEFSGLTQWLPLDPNKPDALGYWLTYQDSKTGENVKIKIS